MTESYPRGKEVLYFACNKEIDFFASEEYIKDIVYGHNWAQLIIHWGSTDYLLLLQIFSGVV